MKISGKIARLVSGPLLLFLLLGCATQKTLVTREIPPVTAPALGQQEYVIQAADELAIKFYYNPELNETVSVRPDGRISLQLIDDVLAAGLTPAELDEVLSRKYAQELEKPAVTVIVRTFTGQKIYVGGEVNKQGLIDLSSGMSALEAVIHAGGFLETADPEQAIVIRKAADNRPFPIPVDLKSAIYGRGSGTRMSLHPFDIVYIPKSFIAKANKFVNQYIAQLLMFNGINFGFSYELHDAGGSN